MDKQNWTFYNVYLMAPSCNLSPEIFSSEVAGKNRQEKEKREANLRKKVMIWSSTLTWRRGNCPQSRNSLVTSLTFYHLTLSQVAELKEVFMLFDRDEDGVLSFQELQLVMKSMGQRPPGEWRHKVIKGQKRSRRCNVVGFDIPV